jgi:hypothetical protein
MNNIHCVDHRCLWTGYSIPPSIPWLRNMQSENGILLLFNIFLSHGIEKNILAISW